MVTAIVAGLLGLVGTALGAVMAVWVAGRAAARSEHVALQETLRQEFRAAAVRFAARVIAYRTAELDRWHALRGGWKDQQLATEDVYRTRSAAWEALYELDLSTDEREAIRLARCAIDRVYGIRLPESKDEMNRMADEVYRDLDALIAFTRAAVRGDVRAINS